VGRRARGQIGALMDLTRRELLLAATGVLAARLGAPGAGAPPTLHTTRTMDGTTEGAASGAANGTTSAAHAAMYGLIGKITATPGDRDRLAAILLEGTGAMPGCLSYVVAADPADADALWVTEVWDSAESHRASLQLPAVQAAIRKGRPLIAGFGNRAETRPLGGVGLPPAVGR
jgi:quinol monooxygenase YgiN